MYNLLPFSGRLSYSVRSGYRKVTVPAFSYICHLPRFFSLLFLRSFQFLSFLSFHYLPLLSSAVFPSFCSGLVAVIMHLITIYPETVFHSLYFPFTSPAAPDRPPFFSHFSFSISFVPREQLFPSGLAKIISKLLHQSIIRYPEYSKDGLALVSVTSSRLTLILLLKLFR